MCTRVLHYIPHIYRNGVKWGKGIETLRISAAKNLKARHINHCCL